MKAKRVIWLLTGLLVLCTLPAAGGLNAAAEKVVLRMGDNIPDRNSPWGLVIEEINAEFMRKHPHVEIVTESLQDQPYQQKIRIYAASNQLPDVFKYWSHPPLLGPMVENDYIMALNPADYDDMGFVAGSLEVNMYDGKLYGLPTNADFWVIYYNQRLFEENKVEVPATMDELLAAAEVFQANGIIPISTMGREGWPLVITFDTLVGRYSNDFDIIQKALDREARFTEVPFLQAARKFMELVNAGLFQADLLTSDYGAARNLFGQEVAAMHVMGSWELGLSTDTAFSEQFRENVRAMRFPAVAGEAGDIDNLSAWFGGNYVVSAQTEHKELALDYLDMYFTRYPDLAWEKKVNIPAQVVRATDEDGPLAQDLLAILGSAKATGDPSQDRGTPAFKEAYERLAQELVAGIKTPEQFVMELDRIAEKYAE